LAIGAIVGAGAVSAVGAGHGDGQSRGSGSAQGKVQSVGGLKYVTTKSNGAQGFVGEAHCPRGTHVLGGGVHTDFVSYDVDESYPIDGGDPDKIPDDGWAATLNDSAGVKHVYAICK
jgi:hypothetical protein